MIVPFYNVEAYLADCLDSILGQTFGDFEVLLVDDGLDGSRAIAERYADRDAWLRIVTQENGGLGAARNTGVRERARPLPDLRRLRRPAPTPVAGAAARQRAPRRLGSSSGPSSASTAARDGCRLGGGTCTSYDVSRCGSRSSCRSCATCTRGTSCSAETSGTPRACGPGGVAYEDQPIVTQLFARAFDRRAARDRLPLPRA